jgi:hypothetical protein
LASAGGIREKLECGALQETEDRNSCGAFAPEGRTGGLRPPYENRPAKLMPGEAKKRATIEEMSRHSGLDPESSSSFKFSMPCPRKDEGRRLAALCAGGNDSGFRVKPGMTSVFFDCGPFFAFAGRAFCPRPAKRAGRGQKSFPPRSPRSPWSIRRRG